jgi:hypothetical protein
VNYSARALGGLIAAIAISFAAGASAQDVKHYRFAYDQPATRSPAICSPTSSRS